MALFWVRPNMFLSLDRHMRTFLNIRLPPKGLTAEFYRQVIAEVQESGQSPISASHEAWIASRQQAPTTIESPTAHETVNHWLVGAYWHDVDPPDQTSRFLEEGIWENGYEDRYLAEVKAIAVGDKIAIKSSSTLKHGLPFDARGKTVSRLTIKAIGTVIKNLADGRRLEVEWEPDFQPRDWYFFTNRSTVWRIRTDSEYGLREYALRLVNFVWGGAEQDYGWFVEDWYGEEKPPWSLITTEGTELTQPYGVEDVLADGAFMDLSEVEEIVR